MSAYNLYSLKFVYFDKLDLGKEYFLSFGIIKDRKDLKYAKRVKLIKATAKGYNFLDVTTNKCIMKRHLYINKSGQIVLHKSVRVTSFEIAIHQEEEKFINLEPVI